MTFEEAYDQHFKAVLWQAGKQNISGYDYEDLVSVGYYTLWKCTEQYDESKGVNFITYLTCALRNEYNRLYRLSTMQKRKGDYQNVSMYAKPKEVVGEDVCYMDVIEDRFECSDDAYWKLLRIVYDLPNNPDTKIFKTMMYHKMLINEDVTMKDFMGMLKFSRGKLKRIYRTYKEVIVNELL